MVWKALVTSAAALSAAVALADPESPPIWTETFANGDVYTINADQVDWASKPRTVWIRGDHRRNKSVSFRSSLQRIAFPCNGTAYVMAYTTYDGLGNPTYSWDGFSSNEAIRPDTMREWASKIACR